MAGPLDSVDVFQSGFVVHRNASFYLFHFREAAARAGGAGQFFLLVKWLALRAGQR